MSLIAEDQGEGSRPATPGGGAIRILVAEDNPINRKVLILLLKRMGYSADLAEDGVEAVEMASVNRYDAILMDLHMPRLGGIEATAQIVSKDPTSHPRVVAVTADTTAKARAACLQVGMAAYITKPIDSDLLLRELKLAEADRDGRLRVRQAV
jgi:CheY-like chemotaxis protein